MENYPRVLKHGSRGNGPPQFYRCYSFIKLLHLLSIDRGLPVAMFDYLLGIQNGFGLAKCSDTDADWWQGPRTLTETFIHQFQPKKVFLSGNFDLIHIIQIIQIPSSSQSHGGYPSIRYHGPGGLHHHQSKASSFAKNDPISRHGFYPWIIHEIHMEFSSIWWWFFFIHGGYDDWISSPEKGGTPSIQSWTYRPTTTTRFWRMTSKIWRSWNDLWRPLGCWMLLDCWCHGMVNSLGNDGKWCFFF